MSNINENNNVFQPLEMLEKRPIPIPYEKVNIRFPKKKTDDKEIQKEELKEEILVIDEKEDIVEKPVKLNITVLDKRRQSRVDREAILKRIRPHMEVKVIDETKKSTSEDTVIAKPIRILEKEEEKEPEEEVVIEKEEKEPEEEVVTEKEEKEPEEEPVKKKPGRKRKLKIVEPEENDVSEVDLTKAVIRTQKVSARLPSEKEKVIVKASSYYMNNRKIFIQKLTELFKPYQKELLDNQSNVSCDNRNVGNSFDLLTHQKIVRDYLNLYTPYRGLLLYHGLGSGKTCTSIAIAEGMKTNKRVFVMTPASLKMNFFSEMKKCGDDIYKKNTHWEYISIEGKPEYVGILAKALSLSTQYIRENGGAWLININKESNYESLDSAEQESLDDQLNEMIRSKYTDINYNGMNNNKMRALTGDYTRNPFDNSVIVIDEAHNFVSRIVNKIKQPKSISYMLYDYIMSANNAKVVLLTGTPIINYPNEIGVLYNLLRGYITSWTIPIKWERNEKMNTDVVLNMLDKENMKTFDLVDYGDNKITITRNPFGFVNTKKRGVAKGTRRIQKGGKNNKTKKKEPFAKKLEFEELPIEDEANIELHQQKGHNTDDRYRYDYSGGASEVFEKYNGVKLDEAGNITNAQFLDKVLQILRKNGVTIMDKQIKQTNHKALPDDSNKFLEAFVDVDSGNAKSLNLFQRRILGLTSYFRSAQEELLPSYVKTEEGDIYHIEKSEMTDHQFSLYEKIRKVESDKESKTKKMARMKKPGDDELFTISSTYRIFSRAACNFTFPPDIERPIPNIKEDAETTEEIMDMAPKNEIDMNIEGADIMNEELDEVSITEKEEENYSKRIEIALKALNAEEEGTNRKKYLSKEVLPTYSPKFAKILENLTNLDNEGLHLIYSHFRTMEGIGILRLILLANGFAEFKIKRVDNQWQLVESAEDKGKPKFVLYTGTETAEEKEIIRNVYNSMWEYVPSSLTTELKTRNANNHYGEIIKIMMITSSGAEGINLRNTRFVHIVEPYWHMVRVEQVVGRARRICSHQDLPEELRTVKVYLYVSTLSAQQKKDEKHIELIIRDTSRLDKKTPITTDETLYELASMKQRINNQILTAVKESAIDCNIYANTSKKDGEQLVCYGFGKVESNQYSSYPSFEKDKQDKGGLDTKKVTWKGQKIMENGIEYVLNPNTKEVYDYNSYQRAKEVGSELVLIGKLVKKEGKIQIERM
jgi:hypothetical protein